MARNASAVVLLRRLSGNTSCQATLGLERDQPGDGIVPTLSSGPSVPRPTVADLRWRLFGVEAGAISGLSFGRC